MCDESDEVTLEKLTKLNGVLFPGGSGDYLSKGRFVLEQVKRFNDEGTYYPLMAICLGLQNLCVFTSDLGEQVLDSFPLYKTSIPLEFKKNPRETQIFSQMRPDEIKLISTEDVNYNNHHFAVKVENFETDKGLKDFWEVTAVHKMPDDGREFVAAIESKQYPIYATMFHPEKATTMFYPGSGINRSWPSI